jgi:Kef-type K+ transport system membrane component KefB
MILLKFKTILPRILFYGLPLVILLLAFPIITLASEGEEASHGAAIAKTFLWLAILFVMSKLGSLIEKIGQPSVLGEIIVGVVLGNLAFLGIHFFEPAATNEFLKFLAEFGVVILIFRIGLESNIKEMSKVGLQALLVAVIGVLIPFALGTFVIGNVFFAETSLATKLFLGASLTATSVGITARVFQELGKLKTKESKIVLGAAVIDDVLGLLILAVVSSLVSSDTLEFSHIAIISAKAIGFLIAAIILGQLSAPYVGKILSKVHTGVGMKLSFAMFFALLFAYLASVVGLAPIVGAFAAGLVLDPVHFKVFKSPAYIARVRKKLESLGEKSQEATHLLKEADEKHVEDLVDTLGYLFIPLFFVMTGLQVKLDVLFDPKVLLIALAVTMVAFIGKLLAGLGTWGGVKRSIVGIGMIPRGEVGLIFANVGKALGVMSDEMFSIVVIMVILTTLITPPLLTFLIKRQDKKNINHIPETQKV